MVVAASLNMIIYQTWLQTLARCSFWPWSMCDVMCNQPHLLKSHPQVDVHHCPCSQIQQHVPHVPVSKSHNVTDHRVHRNTAHGYMHNTCDVSLCFQVCQLWQQECVFRVTSAKECPSNTKKSCWGLFRMTYTSCMLTTIQCVYWTNKKCFAPCRWQVLPVVNSNLLVTSQCCNGVKQHVQHNHTYLICCWSIDYGYCMSQVLMSLREDAVVK